MLFKKDVWDRSPRTAPHLSCQGRKQLSPLHGHGPKLSWSLSLLGDKALSSLVRQCQPARAKPNIFKGSGSEEAEPQRVRDWLQGLDSGNRYHEARRERLDLLMGSSSSFYTCCLFLPWQSLSSSELMCTAYAPSSLCSRLPSRI